MRFFRLLCFALIVVLSGIACANVDAVAAASDRFEVSSVKAVRADIVNTIHALKKGSVAAAKAAFDQYDVDWNGIETYVNTRDKALYGELEQTWQSKIAKELNSPAPDIATTLADAQMMLARFDDAIALVEKGAPLNPLFDDVARLRIVRSPLRAVSPALKGGDFAKARTSFGAFHDKWHDVEDLVKARSSDAYVAIEKDMSEIQRSLMAEKPDVDATTALVKDLTDKYNSVVTDVTKEARMPR